VGRRFLWAAVTFAFGDYLLDAGRRELRRGGEPVALEPQVFDLLVYLVRNRDRVVSKDDLIDAIWGGRIVSDSAVTSRLNAARTAIGDSGAASASAGRPSRGRGRRTRSSRARPWLGAIPGLASRGAFSCRQHQGDQIAWRADREYSPGQGIVSV
jgi:hypothetical protein